MASHRSRPPVTGFVVTGVVGYLVMVLGVESLPAPGGDDPLVVLSVLARLAPVWLVFWLVAGAGGAWYNHRHGSVGRGQGSVGEAGAPRTPVCPECGARREIRRGRGGAPRWVCPRGCDETVDADRDARS